MNPSASGWINKLLTDVSEENRLFNIDKESFYEALRDSGFIYGSNLTVVEQVFDSKDLTEDELCKTNLCLAFLYTHKKSESTVNFVDSVIGFYTAIKELKYSFFQDLLGGKTSSEQLEKIIHKRVQIDANVLTKNFNYFIINALLYIDVLAYQAYLQNETISIEYLKNLEAAITSLTLQVLNSKASKNKYDESLIKLFESSLRYQKDELIDYNTAVSMVKTSKEAYYILDIACMASWTDAIIDEK